MTGLRMGVSRLLSSCSHVAILSLVAVGIPLSAGATSILSAGLDGAPGSSGLPDGGDGGAGILPPR
jgi:hypothetical protein